MLLGGLILGTLAGLLLLTAATAVQVLIVVAVACLGLSAIFALRVVDSTVLRIRGITMTCPVCYRHISYPSYRCPGCGVLHHDIRPGRYGVLRRHCVCGRSLPTLLILGSHQLAAFCPFEGCEAPLADQEGTAAELMAAIFGGPNAGKTRLLTVIVMALKDQAAQRGVAVEYADRLTARRVSELTPSVFSNLPTPRTGPDQPRAYSFYVKPADRDRRLVHLFDTAGEKFYESEKAGRAAVLPHRRHVRLRDRSALDRRGMGQAGALQAEQAAAARRPLTCLRVPAGGAECRGDGR